MTFGTAKPQGLVWAVIQDAAGGDVFFSFKTGVCLGGSKELKLGGFCCKEF